MMSAKDALIAFVRSLPDDVTFPAAATAIDEWFGRSDGINGYPPEWSDAMRAEIRRRVTVIRSGEAVMIPGDEVMRRLRDKIV